MAFSLLSSFELFQAFFVHVMMVWPYLPALHSVLHGLYMNSEYQKSLPLLIQMQIKMEKKTVCHLLSQSVSPPPGWLRPQTDTKVRLWSLVRALSISSLPLLISPLSSCFCVCLLKANLSFPPSLHASTTVLRHCSSPLFHNTPPLPPLFPACICLVYSQGL